MDDSGALRLSQVDPRLQHLVASVNAIIPVTVPPKGGRRSQEEQEELVRKGVSKTRKSKHLLGMAVDVTPEPVDWGDNPKNLARWYFMAGVAFAVARYVQGIDIRWGGDWDGDRSFIDNSFDDLGHIELTEEGD